MISQNKWDVLIKLYINRGLKIIPLRANSKLPAIEKWNEQCSSNAMQCLYWFENNHNMNWGLPCIENNLFVLDLDTHKIEENGIEKGKTIAIYELVQSKDIIPKVGAEKLGISIEQLKNDMEIAGFTFSN